jgi:hypothetical protein
MNVQVKDSTLDVRIVSDSGHGEKKLDLTYEVGGKELVYTGLDGDEFHSKVQWQGDHFVFTIVEHERGRTIRSSEVWTLIDGGKTLKRFKSGGDEGKENTYILARE